MHTVKFIKNEKYFNFEHNISFFVTLLSCGRKDFLKGYICAVKKKELKNGDYDIKLSCFDFSSYKLISKYYMYVLKYRNIEGHYYNPIHEIEKYFIRQAISIRKTTKIVKSLDKIYNKKNQDFSYYRTFIKKIVNFFLENTYKIEEF